MPERVHSAWRRILVPLLSTTLMLGIASIIALTATVGAPTLLGYTPLARACGLANTPTMIANNDPAIPTPVTPNSDPNQPVGFFPGAYYRAQSIDFTEDLSAVPNAPPKDSIKFRWDFGDGTSYASGAEPKHVYQHAGSFAIRVTTYDNVTNSWVDFDSATITVLNQPFSNPPVAKATANTSLVAINNTVAFDATGSKPLVGTSLSFEWNFGDATPDGIGSHVTHVFTIPGRALVTLIVTDSRGAFSTAVIPITIAVSIPQVHLQISATTAQIEQTITFDASQVQLSAGDEITQYSWDFGDQTPKQTTTASTVTHRYTKSGQYHVQVQAIDQQNIPGTASATITIQAAQGAGSGSKGPSFTLIGLGLLIVLAIGALFVSAIWRRQPSPAMQGHRTASRSGAQRQRASGNNPAAARRPPAGRPPTDQIRGMPPAQGQARPQRPANPGGMSMRPPTRPPSQRAERPSFYRDDLPDHFQRD
ncbi:MAG TPA: PKD domain-containing protein [Ktedonobacterales bacterium]|nr:PKD domain-containing protein [Ktedonobacterales bacterium]